jgi:hypothetical protein
MQIDIPAQQAEKLSSQALAAGFDNVEDYLAVWLQQIADGRELPDFPDHEPSNRVGEEDAERWVEKFLAIVAGRKIKGGPVDDSRESIYPDRC